MERLAIGLCRQTAEGSATHELCSIPHFSWENKNNDNIILTSGFPGGSVVKNPPAKTGDTGSSPDPGRSHMPWSNSACVSQLLSLRSRACEPQLLKPACPEPMLRNKGSHHNEKPMNCDEE